MESLCNALVVDAGGRPTDAHQLIVTRDFDELEAWTRRVYMPYSVRPTGNILVPSSDLHAVHIGSMILSRFSYGIPVHLSDFSEGAGMGMALTTVRGAGRHWVDSHEPAETAAGESFLVDTSRTEYWADFDPDHLQVNITFPHRYLEELYLRWTGQPAHDALWRLKIRFGGAGSPWHALLAYCCRCVAEYPRQVSEGPLGRQLEEMLGTQMLMEWTRRWGELPARPCALAPRYVRQAEQYMREHAREAPTLSAVAAAVGISVRALSGAFREFRRTTPMAFLREARLQGVRQALLAAPPESTVAAIAEQWGYYSLGVFAARYRARFAENPSDTLRRMGR
ncbi:MAG: AraC family transcriptional regulator [Proteobacteria bacterium]|nr:AraC family transcriptional regulator [Pseudomonadota bacterium]